MEKTMSKLITQNSLFLTLILLSFNLTAKVDFTKDLLPILEKRCVECHGNVKDGKVVAKGKLNFNKIDTVKESFVAGKPLDSDLYTLVISTDDEEWMPPKGARLSDGEKKIIHDWIAEGGSFEGYTPKIKEVSHLDELEKNVKKADTASILHFEQLGALVLPLSQKSVLLQVNFKPVANKTTSAHLARLVELKDQLVWLNLSGATIDNSGLQAVGNLEKLTNLHLDNTKISDEGLAYLTTLKNLEYLNLYNTKVTDAGLAHLKKIKSLKKIYLWQSQVTEKGVSDLQSALPQAQIHGFTPKLTVEEKKDKPTETAKFDKDSCCDKASKNGKDCAHGCCVKAKKEQGVCKKCNPTTGNK
jgi:Leucine-rich repeat (LRR) protein